MSKLWTALIGAYLFVGVVTFGHSAANAPDPCEGREKCFTTEEERAVAGGFVAGLFWPAYWSWEAWS